MWRRRTLRRDAPDVVGQLAAGIDAVDAMLDTVPWSRWAGLDHEARRRGGAPSGPAAPRWYEARAATVAALADRTGRPGTVAVWLAMHNSGHVREAALDLLATVDDPRALPALVVRTVDWVRPVREKAGADLARRPISEEDAARLLPLVASLARAGMRHAEAPAAVLDRLGAVLTRPALLAALDAPDRPTRRAAADALARRGEVDDAVLDRAVGTDDIVVLRTVARAALSARRDDAALLDRLAAAPVGDLRAAVLHRLLAAGGPEADDRALAHLLDRSSLVRDVAQRHLRRAGVDVGAVYVAALPRPRALRGLAELGDRSAAPAVAPLLAHDRPAVRAAAARAWAVLGADDGRPELRALLLDGSPKVVRAAGLGLGRTRLDDATVERLVGRLLHTDDAGLRRATAVVLGRQDRWARLVVGLRAVVGRPEVRPTGEVMVRSVLQGWNEVATSPSPARRDELAALVDDPAVPSWAAAEVRDIVARWR